MKIPHTVFDYEPIDHQTEDFRLLKLLRSRDGEIRCRLYHAKFDSEPYQALSYAWGTLELVEPIEVNGSTLRVTDNLYAALRHLRLPDRDRVLWIDAICINQQDKPEQSHQVQRMRDVYRNANRVVVWLGKATVEVEILIEWLRQLEQQNVGLDPPERATKDPRLRIGLQTLLRRPWFERVWILQEIANARSTIVCAGKEFISASVFARAHDLLGLELNSHYRSILDLMCRESIADTPWDQSQDLCTLLLKFQACKASDERDKVYALLGMLSIQQTSPLLPDYTLSLPGLVYTIVQYMFKEKGLANDTVLDFLASFSSLTAVCVASDSGRSFLDTITQQNINSMSSRAQIKMVSFMFFLEMKSEQDPVEAEAIFSQATRLSMGYTSSSRSLRNSGVTFTWSPSRENVKVLFVQNVPRLIANADLLGCNRIVEMLVTQGSELGAGPEYLEETLLQAARDDRSELVQLLIEKGADVEYQPDFSDERGRFVPWPPGTALYIASVEGFKSVVRLLLKAGADVNKPSGMTHSSALYEASSRGHDEVVAMLINAGADISFQSKSSDPFVSASRNGHHKTVEILLKAGVLFSVPKADQAFALVNAARHGDAKMTEMLINGGVSVDGEGVSGVSDNALMVACEEGESKTVGTLIQAGADVNTRNKFGATALSRAVHSGSKETVEMLLNSGADVNILTAEDEPILEVALGLWEGDIAQILIDHGAEVDLIGRGHMCEQFREATAVGPEKVTEMLMELEEFKRRRLDVERERLRKSEAPGEEPGHLIR